MPKLDIITNPNKNLRTKSIKVNEKKIGSKNFNDLYLDMEKLMLERDGVGLAAPQVGKNIRICVVNTSDGPQCLVNPKITKKSWAKEWGEEGCLSVPNVFGEVKRHKKITCKYTDKNKKIIKLEAKGLLARVLQHEIDHLDGILFIDNAKGIKKIKN